MLTIMDEVDEGYKDFVSCGVVKFSVDDELPVMILRDTGATQTLLVADESSLGTKNFTGRKCSHSRCEWWIQTSSFV